MATYTYTGTNGNDFQDWGNDGYEDIMYGEGGDDTLKGGDSNFNVGSSAQDTFLYKGNDLIAIIQDATPDNGVILSKDFTFV